MQAIVLVSAEPKWGSYAVESGDTHGQKPGRAAQPARGSDAAAVANGITKIKHLTPDHVRRLEHLALAEDTRRGRLKLTTFGLQRYAALPKTDGLAGLDVDDDFTRKFEKYPGTPSRASRS